MSCLLRIRWATSHLRSPCQWLTARWDVRGLLSTLMMTHCGIVHLILFPALWIKNALWLTLRTFWPFERGQGEKNVCHVEKPQLCCWGSSWIKAPLSYFSTSNPIQCRLWETTHSTYPFFVMCSMFDWWFRQRLIITHGYLKQTARIQIGLVIVMCWNEPSVLITYTMWHGKVEWGSALISHNGW